MKLILDTSQPVWLPPAAYTFLSGGGLAYLNHAVGGSATTTAVTLIVGISYGRLTASIPQLLQKSEVEVGKKAGKKVRR